MIDKKDNTSSQEHSITYKTLNLLSQIDFPSDLRKLDESVLPQLCEEIRMFMIDTITNVGGHLGAGLGVVELTVALHYIFNTPSDKIVFDVGHQGYPHKIITGRKELLSTIRQNGGISGFLRIEESDYDAFGCGHASTSISATLGMSVANSLINPDNTANQKFIAVVGDGSLTGGLAYEGLNNAGFLNKNIIVILNDNNISIDRNVSAFSNYFNEVFSSQRVQNWKDNIWQQLGGFGNKGDRVRRLVSRFEGSMKSIITPGMLFEAIGFNYFGPINGNNIFKLIKMLRNIKNINGPIFLHIITEKGKGYELAEKDKYKLHSVAGNKSIAFDNATKALLDESISTNILSNPVEIPTTELSIDSDKKLKRHILGKTLAELFEKDDKLIAITAAMLEGTGLSALAAEYPDRVFDVGIAEAHAVVFAAGMATQNIVPIVAIYSSFMQRAFDNIIHDCALQSLHIVFALDRAGLVGGDGATHHGVFDIAYLRIIPNLILMAPKDPVELQNMLFSAIYDYKGYCVAIRYPRDMSVTSTRNTDLSIDSEFAHIPLGKSEYLKEGNDICIIALGKMVDVALKASDILANKSISLAVINARFVKPLDANMLDTVAGKFNNIITIEDGQQVGGFGSAVLEYLNLKRYKNDIKILGIKDNFVEHGNTEALLQEQGLDVNAIVDICTSLKQN